jgi:hypothetical protein
MNRAKLLMFAALLMACAGFLSISQSTQAGRDDLPTRCAALSLVLGR